MDKAEKMINYVTQNVSQVLLLIEFHSVSLTLIYVHHSLNFTVYSPCGILLDDCDWSEGREFKQVTVIG